MVDHVCEWCYYRFKDGDQVVYYKGMYFCCEKHLQYFIDYVLDDEQD